MDWGLPDRVGLSASVWIGLCPGELTRANEQSFTRANVAGWCRLGRFEGIDGKTKLPVENPTDTYFQEAMKALQDPASSR
jgi:hypothetical protein